MLMIRHHTRVAIAVWVYFKLNIEINKLVISIEQSDKIKLIIKVSNKLTLIMILS